MDKTNLPLVSICCLCYNHEPYIRECLDGFMLQKTNFVFEVLIHDDASTDKSADIIREYEAKYPDIIKPIYQTENQYSKGVGVTRIYQFPRAKGKYIAMCEGDDYWTDPYKLQKQVDFLETNEEYSICFHPVKVWKENEKELVDDFITREVSETTTILDLAEGNYMHTPSVVFRRNQEVFDIFNSLGALPAGDYILHMLNAKNGKIKKLSEIMGVYRVHDGGVWSNHSNFELQLSSWLNLLDNLIYIFKENSSIIENLKKQYADRSFILYQYFNELDTEKSNYYFNKAVNTNPTLVASKIIKENENLKRELTQIRSSKAYRYGKLMFKPFKFFKTR